MVSQRSQWQGLERLVCEIEELQHQRVLELARRLKPDLTADDLKSPHDVPQLADLEWQYEDGVLAGIRTVLAALRARRREAENGWS
jgi:hypothetical protein